MERFLNCIRGLLERYLKAVRCVELTNAEILYISVLGGKLLSSLNLSSYATGGARVLTIC
jgi:hypothetical protein